MQLCWIICATMLAFAVGSMGAPVNLVATPYIVQYESNNDHFNGYNFEYVLSDEQQRREQGTLKFSKDAEGKDVQVVAIQGRYSYVSDDGQTYSVEYEADENGYRSRMSTGETKDQIDRKFPKPIIIVN